jgi:hypothetical protein
MIFYHNFDHIDFIIKYNHFSWESMLRNLIDQEVLIYLIILYMFSFAGIIFH